MAMLGPVLAKIVKSFKGRSGDITPQAGDYSAADVGAYSAAQTDALLSGKSNVGHTHTLADVTDSDLVERVANKGQPNGYAPLDGDGNLVGQVQFRTDAAQDLIDANVALLKGEGCYDGTEAFLGDGVSVPGNRVNVDSPRTFTVTASGTNAQNGARLLAAFAAARLLLTPTAGPRATIYLHPGVYDFGASTLAWDTNAINIQGISPNASDQVLTSNGRTISLTAFSGNLINAAITNSSSATVVPLDVPITDSAGPISFMFTNVSFGHGNFYATENGCKGWLGGVNKKYSFSCTDCNFNSVQITAGDFNGTYKRCTGNLLTGSTSGNSDLNCTDLKLIDCDVFTIFGQSTSITPNVRGGRYGSSGVGTGGVCGIGGTWENCIFTGSTKYVLKGTFRNCVFGASTGTGADGSFSGSEAIVGLLATARLVNCILGAKNSTAGVVEVLANGGLLLNCTVFAKATAPAVYAASAKTISVAGCLLGGTGLSNITNNIGTPNNVIDTDLVY